MKSAFDTEIMSSWLTSFRKLITSLWGFFVLFSHTMHISVRCILNTSLFFKNISFVVKKAESFIPVIFPSLERIRTGNARCLGCQSHRTHTFITHLLTPRANLAKPDHLLACFREAGRNHRTRKRTHIAEAQDRVGDSGADVTLRRGIRQLALIHTDAQDLDPTSQ